jgi:hypothetical protein
LTSRPACATLGWQKFEVPVHDRRAVKMIMTIVSDGLRVWRTRDGICISDQQIEERSRNIAAAIAGNLDVTIPNDADDCSANSTGGKHGW